MRFFHLADLHLGKTLHAASLIEDQRYILQQVFALAQAHQPDVVLLSGDIYDRQTPPTDAVLLLDWFLTSLSDAGLPVLLISGNHDSPERLGFAAGLLAQRDVHLYAVFDGTLRRVTLADAWGEVDFYLMPYLRAPMVRRFYPGETIEDTAQAVQAALSHSAIDPSRRNVLLAHQFVCAAGRPPESSESEIPQVGGLDFVDASLFESFDYVALGHLHKPQSMGRATVRYSGSPLKYSFSEARHRKSVTMVDLPEKGQALLTELPLQPLRDVRKIEGDLQTLLSPLQANAPGAGDYLHITLTDPEPPIDALPRLRAAYPNVLQLQNAGFAAGAGETLPESVPDAAQLSPTQLFAQLYAQQNGAPPSDTQLALFESLLTEEDS